MENSYLLSDKVHTGTVSQALWVLKYTFLGLDALRQRNCLFRLSTIENKKVLGIMTSLRRGVLLFLVAFPLAVSSENLSFLHHDNLDPESSSGNILDNGDFEAGGDLGLWSCSNCQCSVEQFQAPGSKQE